MKSLIYLTFVALAAAYPNSARGIPRGQWHPPGPGDVRGPCPGLNVLANHGILPRDGKDIDHDMILTTLPSIYNLGEDISTGLFQLGISTTLRPNATTFSFDDLDRHGLCERDASLSRADAYWGDDHTFNITIWSQTRSFWKTRIIDIQGLAKAVEARWRTSKATNPEFSVLGDEIPRIGGAAALFTSTLGDHKSGTVRKDFVREWFEIERLPTALGWRTSKTVISQADISDLAARIYAATNLANETGTVAAEGVMMHVGITH